MTIFKQAYANYRANWEAHDRISRINRAGRLLTRAAKRFLRRKAYFAHERIAKHSTLIFAWSHIMLRDKLQARAQLQLCAFLKDMAGRNWLKECILDTREKIAYITKRVAERRVIVR